MRNCILLVTFFAMFLDCMGQADENPLLFADVKFQENRTVKDSVDVHVLFKLKNEFIPDSISRIQIRIGGSKGSGEIFSCDYFPHFGVRNKLLSVGTVYKPVQGVYTFSGITDKETIKSTVFFIVYIVLSDQTKQLVFENEVKTNLRD